MQSKFNFWSVEGALTRLIFKRNPVFGQRRCQILFRTSPHIVSADALLRAGGEFNCDLFEAKGAVNIIDHSDAFVHFGTHLLFRTEDMGVILSETTHAHQAMQRTRRLVAVATAELAHAQRQITVRLQALVEDLHVSRAVHRLDAIFTVL
ncbi:hypothetical protein D3C79_677010 [compost metagenome]